jgi:hypothetical protein
VEPNERTRAPSTARSTALPSGMVKCGGHCLTKDNLVLVQIDRSIEFYVPSSASEAPGSTHDVDSIKIARGE